MEEKDYDIFISYSSKDERSAHQIRDHLVAKKYKVWLDTMEVLVGENIVNKVFDGIRRSRFLAILLTPNSVESKWVKEELSAAFVREMEEGNVVILPLLYEDCVIPDSIKSKHYADFRVFQAGLDELEGSLAEYEKRVGKENRYPIPSGIDKAQVLEERKRKLQAVISQGENIYLAVDLGGTKAYASLMNHEAERLFDRKFPTPKHENADGLFEFIKHCITDTIDRAEEVLNLTGTPVWGHLKSICIGFAGPTDSERGIILDAPHLNIKNYPLANKLERKLNIPVFVDNDVNLGVLGESWKGVARGCKDVFGIIIGTGIGGGMIIDGQLYRGKNKTAGEIGHMILDYDSREKACACGQIGCFEVFSSRESMAKKLHERKSIKSPDNLVWDERNLGSNEIAEYYRSGDQDAVAVVNEAATLCGKAVFSILNLLNPEMIFFGGGFIRQVGGMFLEPVLEEVKKCMKAVYNPEEKNIRIEIGGLDNPILVGACKMAIDKTSARKQLSANQVLDLITRGLSDEDYRLLHSLSQQETATPISKHPESDFREERLKPLRNRGLIHTIGDLSFRHSSHIQITELGKLVVTKNG